ncbi:hypothetical protein BN85400890 [Alteracholeplasma palmae J233]|uniref:Uncharacterized protein n=1 Tax=Alteracholeplasma palmae (strain ATCC 49389 / J233) TaxID=1318466 RepID=U4KQW7_ALTPJ|nr:hypothetical protein [Alteracholeplasma palmae]CCV63666.1 hypothetical protein BN85400890 [Alteracholeplasma palmae J233]
MKIRKNLLIVTYLTYFLLGFVTTMITSNKYNNLVDNIWLKSIQVTICLMFALTLLVSEGIAMHRIKSIRTMLHILLIFTISINLIFKINWIVISVIQMCLMLLLFFSLIYTKYEDKEDELKRIITNTYIMSNVMLIVITIFSIIKTETIYISLIILVIYIISIKIIELKFFGNKLTILELLFYFLIVLIPVMGWISSSYIMGSQNIEYSFFALPLIASVTLLCFGVAINKKMYHLMIQKNEF